jgi:hypothetical protein
MDKDNEKEKPLQLRLTAAQRQRLGELAEVMDLPKVTLIRWSVDALLDYVERNNGKLTLPLRFPGGEDDAEAKGAK